MFSLTKMKALWELFQQGKACANPSLWKSHQINSTMLGGVFIAAVQLAKAFNIDIPVDSDSATAIAAGCIAIVNVILTITTSKTIGLPTGASAEAQQAVPSVQQSITYTAPQEAVQPVNNTPNEQPSGSSIDAATVERARAWAAEHGKPAQRAFDNDQTESYVAP